MKVHIVTIFPEFFESALAVSLVGRAIESGDLVVEFHDPRDHTEDVHRSVDDAPYGGGAGMVMMVEPLAKALDGLEHSHRVLFAAAGAPIDQKTIDRWSAMEEITLVCGRYEGVDHRIAEHMVDEEVSLGDFVMLGGEVAALAVIEGVTRLLPGVVGNPVSIETESFRNGLLEEPQYTRPSSFRGWEVPEVLLSGDHARIEAWRAEQRRARTADVRPDLLSDVEGSVSDV